MVSTALGIVLEELGRTSTFPISGLIPDVNNSCMVELPGGLKLQFQLDKNEQNLLIGCPLGKIPKGGTLRADLFQEALRANNFPYPRYGTFAYSTKTEDLMLFDLLHLNGLTGDKLGEFLVPFVEKASTWSKAIAANELPPITFTPTKGLKSIFELIK